MTTVNKTLTDQLVLYTNRLFAKEAYNKALQTEVRNLQGKVKNLKYEIATLKIQVTMVTPAPLSSTEAYLSQIGKYKEKLTTPPGW